MRNITSKFTTLRTARALATVKIGQASHEHLCAGTVPKGDPLPVAKVAAVLAAKKTTEWIPYCHNIPIESVDVDFRIEKTKIEVEVSVATVAKTGVEMEALTAAAAAALTLYDMLKMVDDDLEIGSIKLLEKRGGKSDRARTKSWNAVVIVCSDRASQEAYEDVSGEVLCTGLKEHGAAEVTKTIIPDSADQLQVAIRQACILRADLIVITGGTGIGPRDITTKTVTDLIEQPLPGVVQALLNYGQDRLPGAMLSRPVAGAIGSTIVLAIPGSPGACKDALSALFPEIIHALSVLAGEGHE